MATPPSFIKAVNMHSKDPFPKLFVLLQIGYVKPVTSCKAEQTFLLQEDTNLS